MPYFITGLRLSNKWKTIKRGVSRRSDRKTNPYVVVYRHPITKRIGHYGSYATEADARKAYKKRVESDPEMISWLNAYNRNVMRRATTRKKTSKFHGE